MCGSFSSRCISGRQSLMPSPMVRINCKCDVDDKRRSCKSWRKPLLIASAMTREATPATTPMIEMIVMIPTTACLLFARKYRDAMKNSNFMGTGEAYARHPHCTDGDEVCRKNRNGEL